MTYLRNATITLAILLISATSPARSQSTDTSLPRQTPMAATSATVVPMLVRYDGDAVSSNGKIPPGGTSMTFLIYKDEKGGEPLWIETQSVVVDTLGKYEVYLGSTYSSGLPPGLFGTGEARWLEVQIAGETPAPRTLLTSVPYALKAADAATLGGLPASAFALAGSRAAVVAARSDAITPDASSNVTTAGGTNFYVPRFNGATTIINSQIYDNGTSVGIGDVPNASAKLDVNGAMIMRGNMTVSRTGNATSSKAFPSYGFDFLSNVYNSSTKATDNPYFQLQSEPTGNNTSSPSATFNLFFSNNGSTPADTGFYINPNGTVHFASQQTFPATSSSGTAVDGTSNSGTGVQGNSTSSNGVYGISSGGDGVQGVTAGVYLDTAGVYGIAGSGNTSGFNGIAGVWGDASQHVGVLGTSDQFSGVQGQSENNYGVTGSTSGGNAGVYGTYGSASGVTYSAAGVWGDAQYSVGVLGTSYGSFGVVGDSTGSVGGIFFGGPDSQGLVSYGGANSDTSMAGTGGEFRGGVSNGGGTGGYGGVFYGGDATADYNDTAGGPGIYAFPGIGENNSYADAGVFVGNVIIEGSISNSAAQIKIDHPSDPANQYLMHALVGSSEQMNIYSGNVITDELGLATIVLPEWFEGLNTDFRYQLTVIGQFAQAVVKDKIANNKFTVMTNAAHVEVSWQVTAVRNDAYAKAHPMVVAQQKPVKQRGFYIHPEAFGQPHEKQTEYGVHPEMMAHMKAGRERPALHPQDKSGLKKTTTP